jgi:hypothetical protein
MGCAVLVATIAFAATPARACTGLGCVFVAQETKPAPETRPVSAPLKLDRFTRRKAKAARGTVVKRASKSASAVKARKQVMKRARSKGLFSQAARSPAIPVRVVASEEWNEIDMRADPPVVEQAAMAFAEEPVRPARVSVITIDRKPKAVLPAQPVAATSEREQSPEPQSPPDNWVVHVWLKLQTTVSNVAAAVRRFGE